IPHNFTSAARSAGLPRSTRFGVNGMSFSYSAISAFLELQPPAQPHRCVAVECPIRFADGAYLEVVRPSDQQYEASGWKCSVSDMEKLPCNKSARIRARRHLSQRLF